MNTGRMERIRGFSVNNSSRGKSFNVLYKILIDYISWFDVCLMNTTSIAFNMISFYNSGFFS